MDNVYVLYGTNNSNVDIPLAFYSNQRAADIDLQKWINSKDAALLWNGFFVQMHAVHSSPLGDKKE